MIARFIRNYRGFRANQEAQVVSMDEIVLDGMRQYVVLIKKQVGKKEVVIHVPVTEVELCAGGQKTEYKDEA